MAFASDNISSKAIDGLHINDVDHFEFVLDQSHEFLYRKLDLERSILLDTIVQAGIVSQEEKQCIQSECGERQTKTFIQCMKTKETDSYVDFCRILETTGHKHIREEFKKVIPKCLRSTQRKLCQYFLESYSQVDLLSVHDEGNRVRLDSIYVPIKTATYVTNTRDDMECQLDHYTDLFISENDIRIKRILIRGEPMAGKTTFIRKISYDWAKIQTAADGTTPIHGEEKLQNFILVIPVILRLIKNMDILQNIAYQMDFLTKQDLQILKWMLNDYSTNVLFLYDGLDEFNDEVCPQIVSHIKGVTFPGSSLILTSRGEGVGRLQEWRVTMHVEAELQGFGHEEIKQYISLYFRTSNNPRVNIDSLLQKIFPDSLDFEYLKEELLEEKFELYAMAKNPGRLDILCLLWEQNQSFSENREELYGDFVKVVLQLAAKRNEIKLSSRDVLVSCRDVLLQFGRLAMTREANNMVTVFTMDQVEEAVGRDALKWGFLYKSHPVSRLRDCEVSFLHKTIQEWLGAYYVSNTEDTWKDVSYNSVKELQNESSFHRFLLHMDRKKMNDIASAAVKKCFNKNIFDYPNEDIKSLLQWQMNCGIDSAIFDQLRGTNFSESVTRAVICGGNCKGIGHLISSMSSCKCWSITFSKQSTLKDMISELKEPQPQIEDIEIYKSTHTEKFGECLGRLILLLPGCRKICLTENALNVNDIEALVAALNGVKQPQITDLDLTYNPLEGAGRAIGLLIKLLPNVKKLAIGRCKLIADDLEDMLVEIESITLQLEQFIISDTFLVTREDLVTQLLERMPKLRECYTNGCYLQEDIIQQKIQSSKRPLVKFL